MVPQAGMRHRYGRGEVIADAAAHALGAAFGLAACGLLAAATLPWAGRTPAVGGGLSGAFARIERGGSRALVAARPFLTPLAVHLLNRMG
jgi:hypothetical protein